MDVKCDAGTVAFTDDDAPQGFYTPEKLGVEAIKYSAKDNNPFAALAGPITTGIAESALEGACGDGVSYIEPNDDGITTVAPPVATEVVRGGTGNYKDGIQVTVKDVFSYEWIKANNPYVDAIEAGPGQKLIVVDLVIGNDGQSPSTLSGREFQLEDSEGRRFNPIGYEYELYVWTSDNRPQDIGEYDDINPGSTGTETLVFRVPDTATSLDLVDRNEYVFQF